MARTSANLQAAAWFERLSQPSITTEALREFFEWRGVPRHRAAYDAVEAVWERTRGRFKVQPDERAFTVFDSQRGEPATFANAEVSGVDEADAVEIARILNRRAITAGNAALNAH